MVFNAVRHTGKRFLAQITRLFSLLAKLAFAFNLP
jgi:hypothetical protein